MRGLILAAGRGRRLQGVMGNWRACSDVLGAIDALGESRPASAAARAAAFHSRRTAHHV
jgi:hypothetical protein